MPEVKINDLNIFYDEAGSGEPCLGEDVSLDAVRHGLCIPSWLLGLAVVIDVIRPKTIERHVRPPSVVPGFELRWSHWRLTGA